MYTSSELRVLLALRTRIRTLAHAAAAAAPFRLPVHQTTFLSPTRVKGVTPTYGRLLKQ